MKISRRLSWIVALVMAVAGPVPAQDNGDFGTRFFEQLKTLFGELEQSDLDRAFERAKAIRCTDLAARGEWKQVAFLNDDRSLGDWHLDTIDKVKKDLAKFVFSGSCFNEHGPVRLITSFPIKENLDKARAGEINQLKDIMRVNNPVSVLFESASNSYTFQLPYLYIASKDGRSVLYTLYPALVSNIPAPAVAEEFHCKSPVGADLTYRFMLCRTHVVDRDPAVQKRNEKQPLGNAAYYILSDGREAGSTVKLTFDADTSSPKVIDLAEPPATPPPPVALPNAVPSTDVPAERLWGRAPANVLLFEIGNGEFRFRFDATIWKSRIFKPQLLTGQKILGLTENARPDAKTEYCVWRPASESAAARLLEKEADDTVFYSLSFTKELQSATSAIFEILSDTRVRVATLQCYFPRNDTPAGITVDRWSSIVGPILALERRNQ